MPSLGGIIIFFTFVILLYIVIVSFSLLVSPLYVRFRDLGMIWEVLLSVLMYASPIVYPLTFLPEKFQRVLLVSPIAFIVHFSKEGLIMNHFPTGWQMILFIVSVVVLAGCAGFHFIRQKKPLQNLYE
jgi:ABC-type polysaccharide/polyol phosphate export permease